VNEIAVSRLRRRDDHNTGKTSERISREILHDIHDRKLAPGSVLPPESVMAERFGVGRASVREALRILEINGLITIKTGPRGGPVVSDPDSRDFGQMSTLHYQSHGATFRELLDARVTLEPMLAARAAASEDPAAGKSVRKALEAGRRSALTDDLQYARAHSDFHTAVFEAAGNPVLALIANSIKDIWSVRVTSVLFPEDQRPQITKAHTDIARAIERHEVRKAERLMREHMEYYQQYCEMRYPARLDDTVDWS
jgi:GntR family transcriptional repressor for pyruvate dehydrogenase complex